MSTGKTKTSTATKQAPAGAAGGAAGTFRKERKPTHFEIRPGVTPDLKLNQGQAPIGAMVLVMVPGASRPQSLIIHRPFPDPGVAKDCWVVSTPGDYAAYARTVSDPKHTAREEAHRRETKNLLVAHGLIRAEGDKVLYAKTGVDRTLTLDEARKARQKVWAEVSRPAGPGSPLSDFISKPEVKEEEKAIEAYLASPAFRTDIETKVPKSTHRPRGENGSTTQTACELYAGYDSSGVPTLSARMVQGLVPPELVKKLVRDASTTGAGAHVVGAASAGAAAPASTPTPSSPAKGKSA